MTAPTRDTTSDPSVLAAQPKAQLVPEVGAKASASLASTPPTPFITLKRRGRVPAALALTKVRGRMATLGAAHRFLF